MSDAIAKVVVDLSLDREFDYRIPAALAGQVHIGSQVRVPFGRRLTQGYVVGLADASKFDPARLKEISEVVGKKPLLGDNIVELTRRMGRYYCCPVELCVKCALPEVVRKAQISCKERQHAKPVKLLDVVALLDDHPADHLVAGQVGTVVELLAPGVVEVEFLDADGRTLGLAECRREELLVLKHEPAVAA